MCCHLWRNYYYCTN